MKKHVLNFDNLGGINNDGNGNLRAVFDETLREVERDVIENYKIPGKRTITIKVSISPDPTDQNQPNIVCSIAKSNPPLKIHDTRCVVGRIDAESHLITDPTTQQSMFDYEHADKQEKE